MMQKMLNTEEFLADDIYYENDEMFDESPLRDDNWKMDLLIYINLYKNKNLW